MPQQLYYDRRAIAPSQVGSARTGERVIKPVNTVATIAPPRFATPAGPVLKGPKPAATVTSVTISKGKRGKTAQPRTPKYAVSPLPLSSDQIAQIDMMRRQAFQDVLGARSMFDEGTATAELEAQMANTALRRQTALAAQDVAARAGARGLAASPAVLQRAISDLQERADTGFTDVSRARTSRLADLTRQLQRARGQYDMDLASAAGLEARYRANPRGLMGLI